MLKSLYRPEWESYTDEANELSQTVYNLIMPIIKEYQAQGFALRDICAVITGSVECSISQEILSTAMAKRKFEHDNKINLIATRPEFEPRKLNLPKSYEGDADGSGEYHNCRVTDVNLIA